MELHVSTVPDMKDCFVALPLRVIDALQGRSRDDDDVFSVTLELRYPQRSRGSERLYLSWAGASSRSSSIEVSKKLAECIGLSDGAVVYVRALTDVANALSVEVEPATEDDWEILELNAGFAEDHILSQVGVLSSGQLFPIWVRGDIVLTFRVIAATPKQVVRLVPGTELIVAPKPRKKPSSQQETTVLESSIVKACLRVQELNSSLLQPCEVGNFKCSIAPTTIIFISANTAKKFLLTNGQLVIVRSLERASKSNEQNGRTDGYRKEEGKLNKTMKSVVLRVVYSHVVAKGHVMLSSAVQHFIGAQTHTRIEIRSFGTGPCLVNAGIVVSPLSFEGRQKSLSNSESLKNMQEEGNNTANDKTSSETLSNMEKHKHVLKVMSLQRDESAFAGKAAINANEENTSVRELFRLWAVAQFNTLSGCETENSRSIPISKETVIEFLVPKVTWYEYTVQKFPSKVDTGKSSEVLYFLISLKNSEEIDEKLAGKLPKSVSTSYNGFFLFDQKHLQIEESRMLKESPLRFEIGQRQVMPLLPGSELSKGYEFPSLASLPWLKEYSADVLRRLQISLSAEARDRYRTLRLPPPGYVLLHGPPACGKTKLALAIARDLTESPIVAHIIIVNCSELVGEHIQAIRGALEGAISEASSHSPSLVILDDLDMAIPSNSGPENREPSTSSAVLAEFLADILDASRDHDRNGHGQCIGFLALAQAVSSLPTSLCTSGRFDLHVALPTPASAERAAILLQELENRRLECKKTIISETALKCDGYDAADLEVLVDRAVHSASTRLLSLSTWGGDSSVAKPKENGAILSLQTTGRQKFELLKEDFEAALEGFLPVAMRDIGKPSGQLGHLSWEDVGGLSDTCRTLQEMLELPVKFSKIFSNAPLRLRSGVLLYGPPGCGKTHVVAVAASACSLRLISVKGPELLNKYIGASEQGVRDIFARAAAAAPCILFFDEFDAIAPKRGHDNTGVTDRVVNQLLTELDGVEALNGVFVFAATSRPDLLDAALLRPGRLDRLLLCDFPSRRERLEILQVLSRKLPLSEDVNLDEIASLTENLSGADLQAILSDAQLEAVHSFLSSQKDIDKTSETNIRHPIITRRVMTSVLLNARPSVSDQERRRLYSIYDMFMSARSSLSDKRRDMKGKRATLA